MYMCAREKDLAIISVNNTMPLQYLYKNVIISNYFNFA
jgi:hypothetical protein